MDDDRAGGALPGGLLIFVSPAAVIGHGLAAERTLKALGAEIGIVDQDDCRLAGHVHAFIIVPAALGRIDSVTDENELAVLEAGLDFLAVAYADPVPAILELKIDTVARDRERSEILTGNLDQRHLLHPAAIVSRLQAGGGELLGQQCDGLLLALGTGHAAIILVARKFARDANHGGFGKLARFDVGDVERAACAHHIAGSQREGGGNGKNCADHGYPRPIGLFEWPGFLQSARQAASYLACHTGVLAAGIAP